MLIKSHRDLEVYQLSFQTAIEIFKISKSFPLEEKYSLTDQIRRSSRSVSANIGESFRKRKYEKHFVSKLSDSESEAAETQIWLEYAFFHEYIDEERFNYFYTKYDQIISMLVHMQKNSSKWIY